MITVLPREGNPYVNCEFDATKKHLCPKTKLLKYNELSENILGKRN